MPKLSEIGSYEELTMKIRSHERNVLQLTQDLRNFVHMNQDPRQSPNFNSSKADKFDILLHVIDLYCHHCVIVLLVLKVLKILSRKSINRQNISSNVIDALQRVIGTYSSDCQICVEFSNGMSVIFCSSPSRSRALTQTWIVLVKWC